MERIESFETPTLIPADDESPANATTTRSSGEPSSAEEADTFEQAPSLSNSPWTSSGQSVGDLLGELRSKLGPATTALKTIDTAQSGSGQLDLGIGALGRLAGPLSKLSGALGWSEGAIKIPQASRQLDEAWKAYQHEPSKQNAEQLKAAFDGWRDAAEPLVNKVPLSPVAAQLGGLLEFAAKASGDMAVCISDHSEQATAVSEGRSPTAEAPPEAPVDARLASYNADIADSDALDAAVPGFSEIPGELDRKLEAWRSGNGLRALPAQVQASRERVLELHERLGALREERSSSWSPSRRAELASEEKRLVAQLRESLGSLGVAASAAVPERRHDLLLENINQSF